MFLRLLLGRSTRGAPLLALVALFYFAACSGTPSVRLGRDTFERKVTSESRGRIALSTFSKSNGVRREVAGQQMYTMEFTSTLRFIQGGWKGGDALNGYFNKFTVLASRPGGWEGFGQDWKYFERNAELQVDGAIQFENTEKGWRPIGVEVRSVAVLSNRPDEQYYDRFVGFWANRDPEGSDLKIVKDHGRYKLIDQTYNSETSLNAESQALTFLELDMPIYIHLDETGKQLHMGAYTYDRVVNEAAPRKALPAAVPSPAGTVAAGSSAASPAPQPRDAFRVEAVISDPDGYTNVREGASSGAQVISVVRNEEVFLTFEQQGDWWQVKLANGKTGYIHRSRIRIRQ